ncbi:hypothetical protein OBBRIDRAFT_753088 [Obba rivulosa]|uniref:BTB domain-containing protein n=1 Tax=Obba rivulosa TaxID=1052685 RepID=A0A8E2AUZ7_9APHY|nr:hypothetical protein OBBRIDRAFT_753088 [Obba rivulosa]
MPGTTSAATLSHPFTKASADVILRSCDGINFRIHRAILSEVSPVFEGMFSLPQPETPAARLGGLPIVPMAEAGTTLDSLLRLCYPMPDPEFKRPCDLAAVLQAAQKYDVDYVTEKLRRVLRDQFLSASPLEVYAVASQFNLEQEAILAARQSLHCQLPRPQDTPQMPSSALIRLMRYRSNCVTTVISFLQDRSLDIEGMIRDGLWDDEDWHPSEAYSFEQCEKCEYDPNLDCVPLSQRNFLERAITALTEYPCGDTLKNCLTSFGSYLIPKITCLACRENAIYGAQEIVLAGMGKVLDRRLREAVKLFDDDTVEIVSM